VEYVIVSGPENREVVVDGQVAGKTKAVIMVPAGPHEFSLSGTKGVQKRKLEFVTDTSSRSPLEIDLAG